MFPSEQRPIIISQYEHLRLVAHLALCWGNEAFDRPVLPWESFLRGVAFHDAHYPRLDTLAIIGAPEPEWLAITMQGLAQRWPDPVTDIVIKLHLQRLLSYNPGSEREAMMADIEAYVAERLPASGFSREAFSWADQITRLCDNISFYFCFEAPRQRTFPVPTRQGSDETTSVTVTIVGDGNVRVQPWPFTPDFIEGTLVGYGVEDYPAAQWPILVPYRITPSS